MGAALARLSVAPDPLPDAVPPVVKSIVARSLEVHPSERWASAHALAAALDAALRGNALPADDTASRASLAPPPQPAEAPRTRAPQPRPRPQRKRAAWPWAILGAILLGGGAGGGYLLVQDLTKDKGGDGGGASVQIVGADDFDPLGDNGQENSDLADLAIDGDATTAWRTETYSSQDLGVKDGVGLVVVLSGLADVSSVEVTAGGTDWSAEIYVATSPASTLGGWGSPVASLDGLGTTAVFDLDSSGDVGAILLWITRVPESGRLEVIEVRVG
jgi:hypothetical protein